MKARDRTARGIAGHEALDEAATGRFVIEVEIGEPDAAAVFDDEGFGNLADAQRGKA
jgi:hypothetical protein